MGYFNERVTEVGETAADAKSDACSRYITENGTRCQIRECKLEVTERVPPKVEKRENKRGMTYISWVEDPAAPPEKWHYRRTFELWVHA
jgi:hypothetical protein